MNKGHGPQRDYLSREYGTEGLTGEQMELKMEKLEASWEKRVLKSSMTEWI
jgi:hypothetical protein